MNVALTLLAATVSEPARLECNYDREVELARDVVAFDQTEGQGWRPLYDAKCYVEAAELLRDWQAKHESDFDPANRRQQSQLRILRWHEAQMWAFGTRNDVALPLFNSLHDEAKENASNAWQLYVTGTLAFLKRDKQALEAAIARLAAVPKPPGWDNAVGQDGKPISLPWPQNLDVLQGLERCWDRIYSVAYLCRNIPKPR